MLVPKLRFKEFTDDYISSTIGKRGYFYYGKSAPKWSVSVDAPTPCVRYGELYTTYSAKIEQIKSHTNIEKNNLVFSKGNEVLVPRVGEDPLDFCKCSFLSIPNVAIGEMISVYNSKDLPLYISYYFNSKMKYDFAKKVEGGSVSNLYYSYLENIKINIPKSFEEQNKIAKFLQVLDKKIELQTKKIEVLKLYKSCQLSHILKLNNLSEYLLKDIAIIKKGQQVNSDKLLANGNYYMLNGGITLSGYLNEYNTKKNTISISEGGNSCGYVNYNYQNFWSGGHCYTLSPLNINNEYLYYLLKNSEKSIMQLRIGTGLPNIQKKDLENFIIRINKDIKIQKNIANTFMLFDYKVKLESDKLSLLEKMKKGYMQNMFV